MSAQERLSNDGGATAKGSGSSAKTLTISHHGDGSSSANAATNSASSHQGTSSGLIKEVDAGDVVRLMLQFLKEQRLTQSFQTLQEESGVFLNTVESLEGFRSDIKNGRWDTVLSQVSTLKFPPDKLFDLYEQVYVEMLERREMDTAQALLLKTVPMKLMRDEQPSRCVCLMSVPRLLSIPCTLWLFCSLRSQIQTAEESGGYWRF